MTSRAAALPGRPLAHAAGQPFWTVTRSRLVRRLPAASTIRATKRSLKRLRSARSARTLRYSLSFSVVLPALRLRAIDPMRSSIPSFFATVLVRSASMTTRPGSLAVAVSLMPRRSALRVRSGDLAASVSVGAVLSAVAVGLPRSRGDRDRDLVLRGDLPPAVDRPRTSSSPDRRSGRRPYKSLARRHTCRGRASCLTRSRMRVTVGVHAFRCDHDRRAGLHVESEVLAHRHAVRGQDPDVDLVFVRPSVRRYGLPFHRVAIARSVRIGGVVADIG